MILIDKLSYSSKLRKENAGLKCLFSVATLFICVASRSIIIAIFILLFTGGLTVFVGGISVSYYLKLLRIPMIFLLLSTIAIILNFSDTPLSWFAIPLFGGYLTVSLPSFLHALQLILTALGAVSCLYFLSLSTPITDILSVMQQIHIPELLIELMLLIYRFIFVLLDYADAISIAQKSRLGNKNFKTSCYSVGRLMSILLLRSFQKSSRLYDAMESRCYDGKIRVLKLHIPASKRKLVLVLLFDLLLIAAAVLIKYANLP